MPSRPVPTTRTWLVGAVLTASFMPRPRRSADIPAQRLGAAQVDVLDVGARHVHLGVSHQPDHPRQAAGHVDLRRAEQRDVAEAELAGGQCRELAAQVGARTVNRIEMSASVSSPLARSTSRTS